MSATRRHAFAVECRFPVDVDAEHLHAGRDRRGDRRRHAQVRLVDRQVGCRQVHTARRAHRVDEVRTAFPARPFRMQQRPEALRALRDAAARARCRRSGDPMRRAGSSVRSRAAEYGCGRVGQRFSATSFWLASSSAATYGASRSACVRSRFATRSRNAADSVSMQPAAACGCTGSTLGPAKYWPCTKSTSHSSAISASRSVAARPSARAARIRAAATRLRQHAFEM